MFERVEKTLIENLDLERPISGSESVDVEEFEQKYLDAAKVSDEQGKTDQALVYRLLAAICSFHFKFNVGL